MTNARGLVLSAVMLALLASCAPLALAQEAAAEEEGEKHFGLYVEFAYGNSDADEVDTSIETLSTQPATSFVSLDSQDFARAAIGWKLDADKGDVRLIFSGFRETEYELNSYGSLDSTASSLATNGLVPWWHLRIVDGQLTAERSPPIWSTLDDRDGDGVADADEVTFGEPDRTITALGPQSLQNQLQTIDLVYGREFGTRRFSSHWWAGLRHFSYEGNLASGAWLSGIPSGAGFTDGALLNPILFYQQASGVGPTGSWGADFNFFDRGVQLYVKAQTAFLFNSLDVDSGEFFTITRTDNGNQNVLAPARLAESRDKSSWQNSAEVGVRLLFRNGVQVEAGYTLNGYLDVVLRPFDILIPSTVLQAPAGTSALYNTQDLRFEGWHAGLAYQF